ALRGSDLRYAGERWNGEAVAGARFDQLRLLERAAYARRRVHAEARVQHRPAQSIGRLGAAEIGPDVRRHEQVAGAGRVDGLLDTLGRRGDDLAAARGDRALARQGHDHGLREL